MRPWKKRLGIVLALGVPFLAIAQSAPDIMPKHFVGKVVPLQDAVAKFGVKLDADAAPYGMALVTDDNKIYFLLKDAGTRMFFQDKRVLNRPMRLTARLIPESNLLQVVNVHSLLKGKLHDVYYWCDICTIKGYQNTICECCGAPMEYREEPAK